MSCHPYIIKISNQDVALFICKANKESEDFISKFSGLEYESEYERAFYLLGTDVFSEVITQDNRLFFVVKDWNNQEYFCIEIDNEILETLTIDDDGIGVNVIISPDYIPPEDAETYFSGKNFEQFSQIMTDIEIKNRWAEFTVYDYIICFFTEKGKENMKKDFDIE